MKRQVNKHREAKHIKRTAYDGDVLLKGYREREKVKNKQTAAQTKKDKGCQRMLYDVKGLLRTEGKRKRDTEREKHGKTGNYNG